ncbi:hypothetical protein GCM10022267_85280 [Lentzea roselyniae]|uniref:FAD binding domain-containing protein n=2 Tax=Lentzea roselyniae TaxID=531940 RepID=A0ABP7CEN0_9PSEU
MGAGVSGLAAAYRLLRSDWDVVVPAAATPARPGGIPAALTDFGLNAARRLGLLPALVERRQPRCDLVAVDAAGVPLAVHPEPPPHRPVLGQDEMLAVLSDALGGEVDRRGAELPVLVADDCGVTAIFANGDEDWFDLVVGADGACSAVRAAVLGSSN